MAEGNVLVMNEVLCFVKSQFGRVPEKQLKQVLVDFYTIDQLTVAKGRLCDDVDGLAIDNWSRPSRRRNSDNKGMKEIDDIVAVMNFLDHKLAIDKLPTYVCTKNDSMPSPRWCDGELQLLVDKMHKMEDVNRELTTQVKTLYNNKIMT